MPLPDIVEAIKNITVPTTKKQLQSIIGLINYNRDMWKQWSVISTLLSSMTSKQWNWSKEYKKAFDTIKKLVSRKDEFSYLNFNKPFVINTDASKFN